MKIPKTIGLVAVAAVALAALIGAGSAQATPTTLCKTSVDSPYCESGDRYASETAIESSSTSVRITFLISGANATIKCAESSLNAKATAQSGTPLPVDITAWALTGCGTNVPMNNCSSTTDEVGKGGSLAWTTGANGTATLYGSKQVQKWHLKCNMGLLGQLNCRYSFKPTATFQGGSPAQLAVAKMTPTTEEALEGGTCGSKTTFEAVSYSASMPKPAYAAKAESPPPRTQLCKILGESPCSEGNLYPEGTLLEAESTDLHIDTNYGGGSVTVSCENASLGLETKATIGSPGLPIEMTKFQLSGCYWPLVGHCEVTTTYPDRTGAIRYVSGSFAAFEGALHQNWHFACSSGQGTYECTLGGGLSYGAAIENPAESGKPAKISFNEVQPQREGGLCPTWDHLSATFTVTSPSSLYVTQK